MIGISGSLIWSKTLKKLILYLTPVVNFGVKSGGPSLSNPLSSPPSWGPWDLFRSFNVCSDGKERVWCGMQPHLLIPSKIAAIAPAFAVEDLPLGRTSA